MKKLISILVVLSVMFFTGCTAPSGTSNAQRHAVTGGVLGGIAGAVVGHQSDERDAGIAVGAASGAILGYFVGNEQDKRLSQPAPQVVYQQPQQRQIQQQRPQSQPVYRERVYRDSNWDRDPCGGGYVLQRRVVHEKRLIHVVNQPSRRGCW